MFSSGCTFEFSSLIICKLVSFSFKSYKLYKSWFTQEEKLFSMILQIIYWFLVWVDKWSSISNFPHLGSTIAEWPTQPNCFNQLMSIYLIFTFLNVYVLLLYIRKNTIYWLSVIIQDWLFLFILYYSFKC